MTRRVAGLLGAALLCAPAALAAAASADARSTFLAGREFGWACLFKLASGLPCPGCGMTRSILLTLGGDPRAALALNPGGPLLLLGVILTGAALLFAALAPSTGTGAAREMPPGRLRLWGGAYAAATCAVMIAHWARELA